MQIDVDDEGQRKADRSRKKWNGNGRRMEVKGDRDERMVRIIGARHEKLPKTKAAERNCRARNSR